MDKIMEHLIRETAAPKPTSLFYFCFLILTIGLTIYFCLRFKDAKTKTFKRIVFITWLVIVIFEIYKELVYSYYPNSTPKWQYNFQFLPFQLCSMPFYVLPFIIFVDQSSHPKVFDAFLSFTTFPLLFAGILVYLVPSSVLTTYIGVNIQTMIHHGSQIVIGVLALVWYHKKIDFTFFLRGLIVFLGCVSIALILDIVMPNYYDGYFNMFFISPKMYFYVPLFNVESPNIPYPIYLSAYIFGVALASFILFAFFKLLNHLCFKIKKDKKLKNN